MYLPIYQGRDSVWSLKRGIYVKDVRKEGIDVFDEAVGIITLILYEWYSSKRTYDHDARAIPLTRAKAVRRIRYVKTLAAKHGASKNTLAKIDKLIDYAVSHWRLPKRLRGRARKAIKGYNKLRSKVLAKVFGQCYVD
jgi:hypothetical protein